MAKYDPHRDRGGIGGAKARDHRGKHSGPSFIQVPHHVKRSTSYHGLSPIARALLTEIIDRYNGSNNGFIVLSRREAMYELGCSAGSISNATREIDDAGLARPTKIGAWRGREATEWRLMWRRCDKTGDLPRSNWQDRTPYVQLLLPKPAKVVLTDAERARRYRQRVTNMRSTTEPQRHENRHGEVTQRTAEGHSENHRRDVRSPGEPQNGNSSITSRNPRSPGEPHIHIYQREERDGDTGPVT